jgi:hypothetical protein
MIETLKEPGQAGAPFIPDEEVLVTPEMREAGAWAIEQLEGSGGLEDKAVAAYKAMVALSIPSTCHFSKTNRDRG